MNDTLKQLSRRTFCAGTLAALGHVAFATDSRKEVNGYALVKRTDRARILHAAALYVDLPPRTITSYPSSRSPGGPHDYFSQADYFWPNPADPGGKYINRDGQSNPDNFNDHRKGMIALSIQMPALTAAWLLTRDRRYGHIDTMLPTSSCGSPLEASVGGGTMYSGSYAWRRVSFAKL